MELNELKAKAYDILLSINQGQAMLQQVNQEIAKLQAKPKKEEKVEKTTE